MAERVQEIVAGNKTIYEVVRSDDGSKITIRYAGAHDKKVEFPPEMLGTLITALKEFEEK